MPLPDPSLYPPVLKPLRLVPELLSAFNKNYSYSDLVEKKFPKGLDASRLEVPLSLHFLSHPFLLSFYLLFLFPLLSPSFV